MHVHINHMFCTDSNWGGNYDSRYMVSIKKQLGYGIDAPQEEDWNLLEEFECLDQSRYDHLRASDKFQDRTDEELRQMCMGESKRLRPEVMQWLLDNVQETQSNSRRGDPGFCVGSDSYNCRDFMSFNIFFYRRSDALKFIKQWSSHKKPTTYFDYFKGIRKELNLKTKRLAVVEEFTLA